MSMNFLLKLDAQPLSFKMYLQKVGAMYAYGTNYYSP